MLFRSGNWTAQTKKHRHWLLYYCINLHTVGHLNGSKTIINLNRSCVLQWERLGHLSGCFSDGYFRIFSIPLPSQCETKCLIVRDVLFQNQNQSTPVALQWHRQQLCVGLEDGTIMLWNMAGLLSGLFDAKLLWRAQKHDAPVRGLKWVKKEKEYWIISSGNDGKIMITDPHQPWMLCELVKSTGAFFEIRHGHCARHIWLVSRLWGLC
ncbi:hypothetical protein EDD86DRAFT_81748 [Gorgonomyces haynaldii]|nr:hypothetical protein EDD86DRAFT_81748 [Gorgonomyces haynaldii]